MKESLKALHVNSYDAYFIFLAIIPVFKCGLNIGNVTAHKRICLGDYPSVINASNVFGEYKFITLLRRLIFSR